MNLTTSLRPGLPGLTGWLVVVVMAILSLPATLAASAAVGALQEGSGLHAYLYDDGGTSVVESAPARAFEPAHLEVHAGVTLAGTLRSSYDDPATLARSGARLDGDALAPRAIATGGARVSHLGDDVVRQVDDAIERAAQGKIRFPGHDGKVFTNSDELLPPAGSGYYTQWTAAASGAKRGAHRVIVGGNPASPDVIYYWDHAGKYVRVWP